MNDPQKETMIIRTEIPSDEDEISLVHGAAFKNPGEGRAVKMLRDNGQAVVSLVAERDGQVLGHVLFSPVTIDPDYPDLNIVGLAPVGVLPEFQNQGIGSKLIEQGLNECRNLGYDAVVVLGHSEYYPRFGFTRASDFGLDNEYGVDDPFMALELREGVLKEVQGTAKYRSEFEEAEI